MKSQQRFLKAPALILITIVAIINLRNIPIMAEQGYSVLWNYAIAAIAFLIPSALICAQSASQLPQAGGVYHWVQNAFGDRWGFFTIWSEWFNNLIGFPATLLFLCDTALNVFMPHNHNFSIILTILMLILLWLVTWLNCSGIVISTKVSSFGAIIGTIIPAMIISFIAVTVYHLHHIVISHQLQQHHFSLLTTLSVLVTCMASYSGMQVTAFHTPNIIEPRKTLPKALLISIVLILLLTILPTLAIIMTVPHQQLNMITGLWQALLIFFKHRWLADIILICLCFGSFAALSTWMLAPARGLLQSSKDYFLPIYFSRINKNDSPARILILQACVVTAFIFWLYSTDHIQQGFWILAVLTSQFTLIMYCFIFAAAMKNRWSIKLKAGEGFQMPKWLTVISCFLGIVSCLLGYLLSFHKPDFLMHMSNSHYHDDLIVATVIYILVPIYFMVQQSKNTGSHL